MLNERTLPRPSVDRLPELTQDLMRAAHDLSALHFSLALGPADLVEEALRIYEVLKAYPSNTSQIAGPNSPEQLRLGKAQIIPLKGSWPWNNQAGVKNGRSKDLEIHVSSENILCLSEFGIAVSKRSTFLARQAGEIVSVYTRHEEPRKPNLITAIRLAEKGCKAQALTESIHASIRHSTQDSVVQTRSTASSKKLSLGKLVRSFFDTEVLFGLGDFAAAMLTAEVFGIAINAAAGALAVGGRLYETVTGSKPRGLGFFAMAGVSAITTVSIVANGIQKFGADLEALNAPGASDLLYGAGAFGVWTVANLVAGVRRSKQWGATKNPIADHQSWFCLGSILATHGRPLPLLFFVAGLTKILSSQGRTPSGTPTSWRDLADKHLTPSRLRAVAYSISAALVATSAPQYILPYSLWMLGNMAFDSSAKNRSFLPDLKAVAKGKRSLPS